jgi:pimeloyl-ACP methyl ester carboxylesterase
MLTIWLPPGYDGGTRRYPVLYMHDGHNLFDPAKSNFNKVWRADKAMLAVAHRTRTEPHIIVGIWAPGTDRYRQYLPRPIYDAASPALRAQMDKLAGGPIISDAYLRWMTDELKPWVDTQFRTKTDAANTAIAGSSMGGLMSCYAFMARPDIFGQAACVSSHWPSVDPREVGPTNPELQALLTNWFRQALGAPGHRRLWMDHGTATLDAFYAPYQAVVDAQVSANGWQKDRDLKAAFIMAPSMTKMLGRHDCRKFLAGSSGARQNTLKNIVGKIVVPIRVILPAQITNKVDEARLKLLENWSALENPKIRC